MLTDVNTRKLQGSKRVPPVFIKASEVQALTIWDTKEKMRRARNMGNLQMLRTSDGIVYNLNAIDKRFFKNHTL